MRGTVKPTEEQRIAAIARGEEGLWGAMAQAQKDVFTEETQKLNQSRFRQLNQWMDESPRHRELVDLMRMTSNQLETATGIKESDWTTQDAGDKTPKYSNGDLLRMGYTAKEIQEARKYIEDYDGVSMLEKVGTRAFDFVGSWVDSPMGWLIGEGESLAQKANDGESSLKNLDALREEVAGDERQRTLLELIVTGDELNPTGLIKAGDGRLSGSFRDKDADLLKMGYSQDEIDKMRGRYQLTKVSTKMDPEKSIGYQWSKQGQRYAQSSLSGLSPLAQKALGIVGSAAQNLTVAELMGPEAVLMMLSGSGASDALIQSMERHDSADKTAKNGALKFGAGYLINSVGVADLTKTLGLDGAKDTLASKLADVVRSVADNGPLAQQYPAIANAVSGGVDNAMQAFVETYADQLIDAWLGDSDAAQNLFKKDTFLNAVESGLTGGASGALGGAVGTGLGKMNAALDAAAGGTLSPLQSGDAGAATELSRGESLPQRNAEQEESAHAASPQQSPSATASPEGEALSMADMQAQQAAEMVQATQEAM